MTTSNSWQMRTWVRAHATHGTFFVDVDADGTAGATRVHGSPDPRYELEHVTPARVANVAIAMIACEARIAELDRAIVDDTCADLRAYAEQVA